ncbi:2,3-bisphosphoglycerate-independent phosphoglycerate mutase [Candidatus Dependentiae bacterium Noda2021]|nr:2,3-bisphosphoglycerate-independent phosphoglycerate mutase [Candidatus Dependentiae bacterium Noda2021]
MKRIGSVNHSQPITPTALIILDGFGYRQHKESNAIACADTPFFDYVFKNYPHCLLKASGTFVGLPQGFIGNSEVGHMTIGTGQIIEQPLTRIHQAIDDNSFFTYPILKEQLSSLAKSGKTLHIAGILSDAGAHGHIKHILAYIKAGLLYGVKHIVIHAFLDGRDVGPQTARTYLEQLQILLDQHPNVILGTIQGRFYAMDRDHNWQRTQKSYDVMTSVQQLHFIRWQDALDYYYQHKTFDEFIPPTQLYHQAVIKSGDGLIFSDTRPDRDRQLAQAFTDSQFSHFPTDHLQLSFVITPVMYSADIATMPLLEPQLLRPTLKQELTKQGRTIFTIAETEKYAHVTYFFDGGNESVYPQETRVLIPSLKVPHYDIAPSLSADQITQRVIQSLTTNPCDFYLINYANADMVGHTGNFTATVKAIECLDKELQQLYNQIVIKQNGTMYITADHGKAEDMYDSTLQQPRTAHTTNPVPFIVINKKVAHSQTPLPLNQLADIASYVIKHL